jgi:formylglycine-generating enzyme required for sulfatase activity
MHGNVWEWVEDWYGAYPSGNVSDPRGAQIGSIRVIRGGSCYATAEHLRSAGRSSYTPSARASHLGFRLLRIR